MITTVSLVTHPLPLTVVSTYICCISLPVVFVIVAIGFEIDALLNPVVGLHAYVYPVISQVPICTGDLLQTVESFPAFLRINPVTNALSTLQIQFAPGAWSLNTATILQAFPPVTLNEVV